MRHNIISAVALTTVLLFGASSDFVHSSNEKNISFASVISVSDSISTPEDDFPELFGHSSNSSDKATRNTRDVFVSTEETEMVSPQSIRDDGTNRQISGNPYNCWGRTERVHTSYSFASVHSANFRCNGTPEESLVGTEIMKKNWYGGWDRIKYVSKGAVSSHVDVNAKSICSDGSQKTYRGNGYHRVVIGGKWYVARTSSDQETTLYCNAHN